MLRYGPPTSFLLFRMKNDVSCSPCVPCWYKGLSLLAVRAIVAAIFFYHGWQKLVFWTGVEGAPLPTGGIAVLFKVLFVLEVLGAVLVLLGAKTRYTAGMLAVIMVGAIYFLAAGVMGQVVPFASSQGTGWEFALATLGCCLALTAAGAGKYSVDALMCKCPSDKK